MRRDGIPVKDEDGREIGQVLGYKFNEVTGDLDVTMEFTDPDWIRRFTDSQVSASVSMSAMWGNGRTPNEQVDIPLSSLTRVRIR